MQPGCRTHVLIGAWWKNLGVHTLCVFKVRLWNAASSYGLPAGEVIKTRLWEGSVRNQCICFAFLAVAMRDATEFNSYIQATAFRGKRINPVRCRRRKGLRHSVPQRGSVLWFCCTMGGMSFFFRGVNQNIF